MTILPRCPSCGFESSEIRCPRCNALKVVGCSGTCSACSSSCDPGPASETSDGKRGVELTSDACGAGDLG